MPAKCHLKHKNRNSEDSVKISTSKHIENTGFCTVKKYEKFFKNYCILPINVIYYKSLCKAMMWEVTLLEENFH